MTAVPLTGVLHHVRSLEVADLNDQQLVQRFAGSADHAAFAALVRRHGSLVLGVCRRVLGPGPDLDDVFQATFVVLARKAAAIRKQTSVASWLYGVAYRLSLKLRIRRSRRQRREISLQPTVETQAMRVDPTARASLTELGAILDEELQKLPAPCRDALLLCHMEGLSNSEAAQHLGWPLGTLKGRVQRGRDLLRKRLQRRGVTLSATALVLALAEQGLAAVPAPLMQATVRCASPTAVAAHVATLADAALTGLGASKLKMALLAAVTVALIGLAAGPRLFQAAGAGAAATPAAVEIAQDKDKPARLDALGDPLPPGATARLGTIRWRHGSPAIFLFLVPDGKTVVSAANDRWIRVWDAATGKELRRFGPGPQKEVLGAADATLVMPAPPLQTMSRAAVAVTRDGKLVAAHFGDPGGIQIWDIATGLKWDRSSPAPINSQVGALAFAPDGKHLAIASVNGPVRLWDLEAGKVARELGRFPKQNVPVLASQQSCAVYAPDGKTLVSVLSEVENMTFLNHIYFWDPETGKDLRTFDYESRFGVASPVFSRDGKLFAFASPDGDICLLEANTAKLLHQWKLQTMPDWPSLDFNAEGTALYSKGAGEGTLRQWDVKTGKELRQAGAAASTSVMRYGGPLGCLTLSPDGKTLATGGGGNTIRFIDVASGKELPGPDGHSHNITGLGYTQGGKSVVTGGGDRMVRWWEAGTGKQVQATAVPGGGFIFTATPDGRYLAYENESGAVVLLDSNSGKEVAKIAAAENDFATTLLFAPDGGTLLIKRLQASEAVLHDVPSGKERCRVPVAGSGLYSTPPSLFFSPDGKLLAVNAARGMLTVHSAATGKAVQKVTMATSISVNSGAFSPDGRTMALDQGNGAVLLMELATGQERQSYGKKDIPKDVLTEPGGMRAFAFVGERAGPGTLQFSPDGRLIAHAGLNRVLHVWDVASGTALARFEGHQGLITAVAFSPDGHSLTSASSDTTALIWDVQGLSAKAGPAPRALDAATVQSRWADLSSDKAAVAWEAMNALVGASQQAVPFLQKQLPPATVVDAKRIEQLIAQLDHNEFKVRQQAQADLMKIGDQAVPHLQKVLAGKVTLETRQRLEGLQGKLTETVWTGDRLRVIRAVEVLERIGNFDARQALQAMAKGAPGALLTTQARAALDR
jgi:RNA polymerase sigma factor (sigma-70 family)